MPRKAKPFTTGKALNDPPPYFFSPHHPRFKELYSALRKSGLLLVDHARAKLHRPMASKHLLAAYACGAREDKSIGEYLALPINRDFDIGPVRAIYYRELILENLYHELLADTRHANTSFFCSQGRRRDKYEWLASDRYLAKTLMSLGLSWWSIEHEILLAFWNAPLPPAFKEKHGNQPKPDVLPHWQTAWADRAVFDDPAHDVRGFREDAKQFDAAVGSASPLEHIIRGTTIHRTEALIILSPDGTLTISSPTEEDRVIHEAVFSPRAPRVYLATSEEEGRPHGAVLREFCLHKIMLEGRDLTEYRSEDFPEYRSDQRSPFINRIICRLAGLLWAGIKTSRLPVSASPAAKRIRDMKTVWEERGADNDDIRYYLADEFYMLIADLLYHLPVLRGLPDSHRIIGSTGPPDDVSPPPPAWTGVTAEEIRQRLGRMNVWPRKKRKRKRRSSGK